SGNGDRKVAMLGGAIAQLPELVVAPAPHRAGVSEDAGVALADRQLRHVFQRRQSPGRKRRGQCQQQDCQRGQDGDRERGGANGWVRLDSHAATGAIARHIGSTLASSRLASSPLASSPIASRPPASSILLLRTTAAAPATTPCRL